MTLQEMDEALGLKGRMSKVKYNLDKFYFRNKELQDYHKEIISTGRADIETIGDREYCRKLGDKYGISSETIRNDLKLIKRYGVI
tara:strand:+ start:844 stop:1098 length:255 start_codon:yes stop_codon:yes gene_type:complete